MHSAATLIEALGLLLLQHVFSFNSLTQNMSHFDLLGGVFHTTTGAPARVLSDLVIIQVVFFFDLSQVVRQHRLPINRNSGIVHFLSSRQT